jgi:glucokinase
MLPEPSSLGDRAVAAVDIGGTAIKSALVLPSLHVVVAEARPTPTGLAGTIGAVVADVVTDLRRRAPRTDVAACGVVVPGLVDEDAQLARWSVNLGWRDLAVPELVTRATGLRTVLGHDVRAALLAEARIGAARGERNALLVAVGTGIACGILVDGQPWIARGQAGELGHLVVDPRGPACRCGARGCVEALASASAVARAYTARTGIESDARAVAALVVAGDPTAVAVWDGAVAALGQGVAAAVALTGADLVLVGGGLAESGATLLAPLRATVAELVRFRPPPRIERAALGDRAASVGAACLAWDVLEAG